MEKTYYVVSDIHERIDLLDESIKRHIDFSDSENILILLGDYVDGTTKTESYHTLQYIYDLQLVYPHQVIVLKGNHEQWLCDYLHQRKSILQTYVEPDDDTLESFIPLNEREKMYEQVYMQSHNLEQLGKNIKRLRCQYILKHHQELIDWVSKLPCYYENEDCIFVHAGINILDGCHELWKETSTIDDYLMQYPANLTDQLDKVIIAGHVGTSGIKNDTYFHDIYRYKNKIFLDSAVEISNKLNLLKIYHHQYLEIYKKDGQWVERLLPDIVD
ncbi:metallophosphoesterase [Candidatus Stoquefichus massiliensis]|uniref:metallophosphoesterase n=1 Tax=Candidatus Stoquefichus massiliensis TaxID=1470350 RepID=UPI000480BC10|nr:metallophosphoesterase [Candidatus Stoquefichus massiliensis]